MIGEKIKLYSLINNDEACNNILDIYKTINREEKLFLKTLVYCAINKPKDNERVHKLYFSLPIGDVFKPKYFTMRDFDNLYSEFHTNPKTFKFCNHYLANKLGKLL